MANPPTWLLERPFAHRGLHDRDRGRPENTLAAVSAAIAGGYGIEVDVQISHDNEAVVFHDPELARLAGRPGLVADLTSHQLEQVKVGASAETIPRLATVLEEIAGRVPLLVEIKNKQLSVGRHEFAVAEALRGYPGPVAVMVWNPWSMKWLRRRARGLPVGHIISYARHGALWRPWYLNPLLGSLPLAPMARPDFVAYNIAMLPSATARRAQRAGLPLLAWAVHSEDQRALAASEADNMIFEGFSP